MHPSQTIKYLYKDDPSVNRPIKKLPKLLLKQYDSCKTVDENLSLGIYLTVFLPAKFVSVQVIVKLSIIELKFANSSIILACHFR